MTVIEARNLVTKKLQNFDTIRCFEYASLYVFHLKPKGVPESTNPDELFDCLWSVNKTTGLVRDFKPFHISISEYQNGKEVFDFK